MSARVQTEDFNIADEIAQFRQKGGDVGAIVSFTGLVRDHFKGETIHSMTLEHYPGMTEKVLQDLEQQARERWGLIDVLIVHRVGKLAACDQIVLVLVASSHRADAFAACDFLMDFLKSKAPFWKKEETDEGGHWVDAKESDEHALSRW